MVQQQYPRPSQVPPPSSVDEDLLSAEGSSAVEGSKPIIREVMWVVFLVCSLIILVRLEKKLYVIAEGLSYDPKFVKTLSYFMLVNVHVILALFLGFLLFRHLVRLIIERRRGIIGAYLKTKLIAAFVFFALVPSGLIVFASTQFITESFVSWFASQSAEVMDEVRAVGAAAYRQDRKRLSSLAKIAQHRFTPIFINSPASFGSAALQAELRNFVVEYQISAVKIYSPQGFLLASSAHQVRSAVPYAVDQQVVSLVDDFFIRPRKHVETSVSSYGGRDTVRGIAPLYSTTGEDLLGFVVSEEEFSQQIWMRMESALQGFERLKSSSQVLRTNYIFLMLLMLLLIVFCGVWLSVRVARGLSAPLQALSKATREVALGNYSIVLPQNSEDETGQLVAAFNVMIRDLEQHENHSRKTQKNLEELNLALSEKSSNLEVVLESITSGVVTLGATGRVEHVNRAAEKLLGISSGQDMRGRTPGAAFTASHHHGELWRKLEQGEIPEGVFSSHAASSVVKEGEQLLLARAAPIRGGQGKMLGTVVVLHDASDQIMAQKSIAWREVAKRIAHEIKNPITPIKLNAQRLQRRFAQSFEAEDREVFTRCVQGIISQVDTLKDLVHEFTRFARLPKTQRQKGDIMSLIREVFHFYQETYGSITWRLCVDDSKCCEMVFDAEQMRRALMNVLLNSVEALESIAGEGCITLEVEEREEEVRLRVQDNGPGIPQDLRSQVGEAYVSTKPHGSGLGLAIVRQIMADHGGYMVLSEVQPQGLCVLLVLAKNP